MTKKPTDIAAETCRVAGTNEIGQTVISATQAEVDNAEAKVDNPQTKVDNAAPENGEYCEFTLSGEISDGELHVYLTEDEVCEKVFTSKNPELIALLKKPGELEKFLNTLGDQMAEDLVED